MYKTKALQTILERHTTNETFDINFDILFADNDSIFLRTDTSN